MKFIEGLFVLLLAWLIEKLDQWDKFLTRRMTRWSLNRKKRGVPITITESDGSWFEACFEGERADGMWYISYRDNENQYRTRWHAPTPGEREYLMKY